MCAYDIYFGYLKRTDIKISAALFQVMDSSN